MTGAAALRHVGDTSEAETEADEAEKDSSELDHLSPENREAVRNSRKVRPSSSTLHCNLFASFCVVTYDVSFCG